MEGFTLYPTTESTFNPFDYQSTHPEGLQAEIFPEISPFGKYK